jgi:hypothetical protein
MAVFPNTQASIFEIALAAHRVQEFIEYRNEIRDSAMRDLYLSKVEKVQQLVEKYLYDHYYRNQDSCFIVELFITYLNALKPLANSVLDDILTDRIDRLLSTIIRRIHRDGKNLLPQLKYCITHSQTTKMPSSIELLDDLGITESSHYSPSYVVLRNQPTSSAPALQLHLPKKHGLRSDSSKPHNGHNNVSLTPIAQTHSPKTNQYNISKITDTSLYLNDTDEEYIKHSSINTHIYARRAPKKSAKYNRSVSGHHLPPII